MTEKKNLDNIKKLREITGVGFSDCKLAISENNGDIDTSLIIRELIYGDDEIFSKRKVDLRFFSHEG